MDSSAYYKLDYLNLVRAKTKVRGNDRLEKLSFLLNRWNKVIADASKSNDSSTYRCDYAKAHESTVSTLSNREGAILDSLIPSMIEVLMLTYEGCCTPGTFDASAFLIAELEALTDV